MAFYRKYLTSACAAAALATAAVSPAAAQDDEGWAPDNSWVEMSEAERSDVFRFAEDYKAFMASARTELSATAEAIALARRAGFEEYAPGARLRPGAKYYHNNRDRALMLFVVGERPAAEGVRIVASHIDSPRIELKARPVYGAQEFALFQTNYHGGIKTYQWTSIPLALIGRVDKKDGTTIQISVGLDDEDPVFVVPELSPHVSGSLNSRSAREAIELEELDPIAGHLSSGADSVEEQVLAYLREAYDIGADDLVSAELALVPAYAPRDVGFDRTLMAVYGQDDRLSAYASLRALFDVERPQFTAIVHLADNEESGNVNNTGASSTYLVDMIGELIYAQAGEAYRQPMLTRALNASHAVSIDVNPGVNPVWPQGFETGNAPRLAHGVNLKIYGRGFDANSEYIAWTRAYLDAADVPWQTVTYKVGRGGGGTLGREISRYNMDVIDFGAPVLSIHTPYSISSKADVYWMYKGVAAFYAVK